MSGLNGYLETLNAKKTEIENQDIDAYVKAKLEELEPKIRAEAEQTQAYELKVLDIKIEAITDAIAVVEAEKATEVANEVTEEVTEEAVEETV